MGSWVCSVWTTDVAMTPAVNHTSQAHLGAGFATLWPANASAGDVGNGSSGDAPEEGLPRFNESALTVVCVYGALFVVAAVGNLTVFVTLVRGRHRKSRISLMITHLAVADLLVTFIMIPLEIGWRLTTQWIAGNAACKLFLFLRAFGLYLSSNVLVCVSLDRYFAILHPLKVNDARRRGKVMLSFAWATSLVCSVPQSVVFHVSQHPQFPEFHQCVTFGFFTTQAEETAYNLFCVLAMYFIPLLVICFAYSCILFEITSKSRETKRDSTGREERFSGRLRLRRSDMTNIERARSRTLRMTVTIVAAFIWCWTPYVVMTLWYMFDRESAQQVDGRLQDALFIMAVSNSCMNPLVYGTYAMNFRRECSRCFGCALRSNAHLNRKSTVGSGATRSTAMFGTGNVVNGNGSGAIIRNDATDAGRATRDLAVPKTLSAQRPRSAMELSLLSDSPGYCSSFHSEPPLRVPPPTVEKQGTVSHFWRSLDRMRRSVRQRTPTPPSAPPPEDLVTFPLFMRRP